MKLQPLLKNPISFVPKGISFIHHNRIFNLSDLQHQKCTLLFSKLYLLVLKLGKLDHFIVRGGFKRNCYTWSSKKSLVHTSSWTSQRYTTQFMCLWRRNIPVPLSDSYQLLSHHNFNWREEIALKLVKLELQYLLN